MGIELTEKQQACFEKFKRLKVGALFMKMGTGKTRAALELVRYNKPDYLLYLTPVSTKSNIQSEIDKWGCACPYDIVGYETIAASDVAYMTLRKKLETMRDESKTLFIIADESIFIKNGTTKRKKRAKDLRQFCEYALILNGTPIVREERDIYNQMDFLSEKILNMSYWQFLANFYTKKKITRGKEEIFVYDFYEPNRPAFMAMIAPYVYQADLDFDRDVAEEYIWVEPSDGEIAAYQGVRDSILSRYSFSNGGLIALFGELAHAAANSNVKNARVAKYIGGRRIVCFTNYDSETNAISRLCDCYVITGKTKATDRHEIIERFKADSKPLVMTMGVGSYSLNLQFCSEIVYSSVNWNYGKFEQSQYRIKRLGQDNNIKYTYILANLNINKMILANLEHKENLADVVKRLLNEFGGFKEMIEKGVI